MCLRIYRLHLHSFQQISNTILFSNFARGLLNKALSHQTIDTFARKLSLTDDRHNRGLTHEKLQD